MANKVQCTVCDRMVHDHEWTAECPHSYLACSTTCGQEIVDTLIARGWTLDWSDSARVRWTHVLGEAAWLFSLIKGVPGTPAFSVMRVVCQRAVKPHPQIVHFDDDMPVADIAIV